MLAAANSVFGRWDESKAEANIDFMPTILSRFDMIFIVKDEHDEKRDSVSFLISSKPSIHSKCVKSTYYYLLDYQSKFLIFILEIIFGLSNIPVSLKFTIMPFLKKD